MSSVINTVVDAFEAVVAITLTITLIGPILALVSEDFKDWYVDALAPIMSLLGIDDENIISAEVTDQRLMDDENVKNLMTKIALDHQSTQMGILELMAQYSQGARGSMTNYFDYGKDNYVNGLPNTNIKATVVPDAVMTVISTEYGVTAHKISAYVKVPTKEEYLYWKMEKLYGYESWTNTLTYLTYEYTVKYMDYNYGTDEYDVGIYRAATVTINITTEVTITITPVDATNDNKHTYTKVTTETIHSIEGTSYDIDETNIDELIPKDSETDSYTTNTEYGTPVSIEYQPQVLHIVAYAPKLNYVVKWYATNDSHVMYWCYEIGSGNTTLDNSQRYIAQLDMMPIVELRNNKVNVNSNTQSELYLDGKAMLEYIGIDIDQMIDNICENPSIDQITNAYIYFGIDLKEVGESDTVAKLLYHTFEFLYDQNLINAGTQTYSAYTTEGNYNSTMIWRNQTRTVVDGILGPVGTYKGHTTGATLVLRKQETPEQYVEYQIIDVGSTVFIKEGGLYATVARQLQDHSVVMPISRYIADSLTPIEQMEIFGRTLRLAVYSAQVTHLEWYQTEAFMQLLQIAIVVIAIVITILTGGMPATGKAWMMLALKVVAMMAISYALKLALESTDNRFLQALAMVAAFTASAYVGNGFSFENIDFLSADMLTSAVINFSNGASTVIGIKMEELKEESIAFATAAERAFKALEEKTDAMLDYIDTEYVAQLANYDVQQYIRGYDLMRFQAGPALYESWDLLKGSKAYENIYDYDKYFTLGVV